MVPRLETERLILRGFIEADLDDYAAMQADPEVMRFIGIDGKQRDRIETWRSMAIQMGSWALRGAGMWAVEEKLSGRFIGRLGVIDVEGWPEPELGYALARPFWGKGYAREGAARALAWTFDSLGRDRMASFIAPGNGASKRTAAALGGVFERTSELMGIPVEVWVYRPNPTPLA
jgi:RimJ/RimL family protein N-acetyltransferase